MRRANSALPQKRAWAFVLLGLAQCAWSIIHLGAGLWSLALAGALLPVVVALWWPAMAGLARWICSTIAGLSLVFALLTLVAATIGGSFRLPAEQAVLVAGMFALSFLGLSIARSGRGVAGEAQSESSESI